MIARFARLVGRLRSPRWKRAALYRLTSPRLQLVSAVVVMAIGADIVSRWALGMAVLFGGLLWGVDAMLRDPQKSKLGVIRSIESTHEQVIERARQEP